MLHFDRKDMYTLEDLKHIITLLRSPQGCPWDREQTHKSVRRNFIEEAYEVVEAIDQDSPAHLCEELGDVLLQVMFHASIAQDAHQFTLDDVADGICKKLIFRHPHVFGDTEVTNTQEVLTNWDTLKKQEKAQDSVADTLESVARSLPALWRAEKVQKKASHVGFDWEDVSGALEKVTEETLELQEAIEKKSNIQEELGDLLFATVNVARFVNIDPEESLQSACDKFISRFRSVESAALAQGRQLEELSLTEMDALWNQVKALTSLPPT